MTDEKAAHVGEWLEPRLGFRAAPSPNLVDDLTGFIMSFPLDTPHRT